MNTNKFCYRTFTAMLATTAFIYAGLFSGAASAAATAEELHTEGHQALETLYKTNPVAHEIAKSAKAVLVFPSIVKAGLIQERYAITRNEAEKQVQQFFDKQNF